MSTQCLACAGKAQTFLCGQCTGELRKMLTDLPWWLDRLGEEAVGHVKKSDGARGGNGPAGLKGDAEVLSKCTCGHPEHELRDECGQTIPGAVTVIELAEPDKDGNTRREIRAPDRICTCRTYEPSSSQAKLRAAFLSAGRVDARASRALGSAQNTLTTIVRDLCESRGVPVRSVRAIAPSFIGPLLPNDTRVIYRSDAHLAAAWLSERVSAIAADESAGQWFGEVRRLVGDEDHDGEIARLINRPLAFRWLGECPTWNEERRTNCGADLRCREDAVEVYCSKCRKTHNPDRLQLLMMNRLETTKITWDKLLKVNKTQPVERQISERELRRWRQAGKLVPCGFRRPGGREGINRHSDDDVPLYLWPHVRKLRVEKPEGKARTA